MIIRYKRIQKGSSKSSGKNKQKKSLPKRLKLYIKKEQILKLKNLMKEKKNVLENTEN